MLKVIYYDIIYLIDFGAFLYAVSLYEGPDLPYRRDCALLFHRFRHPDALSVSSFATYKRSLHSVQTSRDCGLHILLCYITFNSNF